MQRIKMRHQRPNSRLRCAESVVNGLGARSDIPGGGACRPDSEGLEKPTAKPCNGRSATDGAGEWLECQTARTTHFRLHADGGGPNGFRGRPARRERIPQKGIEHW